MKKTDEQMKKTDEQMKKTDERLDKIWRKIDRLWELFWDFWNTRWEEVEDFFYRYFSKNKELLWIKFDDVEKNIITAEWQEHDIVLINWKSSALISVKHKLHKKDVDSLIWKEMTRMKYYLNKLWSKHKLYGWVASYIVNKDIEEYAKSKWLFVITRSWDNTIILNEKDFEWKVF
jgi:hypothetical protein